MYFIRYSVFVFVFFLCSLFWRKKERNEINKINKMKEKNKAPNRRNSGGGKKKKRQEYP